MIREVYKGVMKAIARRLEDCMSTDFSQGNPHTYEAYLMSGEAFAYEELCKAFHVNAWPACISDFDALVDFARKTVQELGISADSISVREQTVRQSTVRYVSLRMPNRIWKLSISPVFMSTMLPVPHPDACVLRPCRKLSLIMQDLDRMMPVLERMTRNIYNDIIKKNKC